MAQNEQVRVDITADDKASRKLDDVADLVETLEKADVEIPVDANTRDATRALGDVEADARKLTDADRSIVIKAKMDDLRGELRQIGEQADQTARKLDDVNTGGGRGTGLPRAQAISDLTGPLGEVSTTASDLSGVFDGLGDTFEAAADRVGLDAGKMMGAIGGIGLAVTAAATLWGLFRQGQQKAREEQRKLIEGQEKLNELIERGEWRDAGRQIADLYDNVYDAADRAGIPIEEVTRYIAGLSDAMPALKRQQEELASATDVGSDRWDEQARALADAHLAADEARASYDQTNQSLADTADRADRAGDALRGNADDTDDAAAAQQRLDDAARKTADAFDRLRGAVSIDRQILGVRDAIAKISEQGAATQEDLLDLKDRIIELAESAGANPIEVKSTLDKIDRGDLAGVAADAEGYYNRSPVQVRAQLKLTGLQALAGAVAGAAGGGSNSVVVGSAPAGRLAAASVVNVTQYLPRGFRGDALAQADRATRRSGGLYRRAHR